MSDLAERYLPTFSVLKQGQCQRVKKKLNEKKYVQIDAQERHLFSGLKPNADWILRSLRICEEIDIFKISS